jgi:hypothetical protein
LQPFSIKIKYVPVAYNVDQISKGKAFISL